MWQQQAFVIDAKFNAHRTQNHPNFRTLYIRRRNQLLRDYSKPDENNLRNQYLKLRTQLLQQRYNVDSISTSRSISARSSSRVSYISDTPENNYVLTWDSLYFASPPSESGSNVIPTHQAEASRAIVGGNTIAENYAFVGVHHIFDQHRAAVTTIAFAHNDRSKLACASYDGTVSICNVTACPPVVENIFKEHKSAVTGFDWSESNDLLVSCSLDATLVLYDMASKTSLRTIPETSNRSILSCLFHPMNNNLVVIGNNNGLVSVVNVSTGIYVRGAATKVEGRVLSLTFDASGRLLWAGNDKGMITSLICDRTGRINKGKRIVVAENCPITCLSWRAWISREARDPTVLVNCAANVVCLFRVSSQDGMLKLKKKFSNRHKNPSCLVKSTFCPIMSFRQGACIVTGSEDSCVYFLDIERESKPIVNKLQGHACPVLGVSFNYDESLLATSDQQGLVIIWSREKPSTKVLDNSRQE